MHRMDNIFHQRLNPTPSSPIPTSSSHQRTTSEFGKHLSLDTHWLNTSEMHLWNKTFSYTSTLIANNKNRGNICWSLPPTHYPRKSNQVRLKSISSGQLMLGTAKRTQSPRCLWLNINSAWNLSKSNKLYLYMYIRARIESSPRRGNMLSSICELHLAVSVAFICPCSGPFRCAESIAR